MPGPKPIIFAVDDEEHNLDLMRRTLARDCEFYGFLEPQDAIEQAAALNPVVIITDFLMGSMNGVQMMQEIRKRGVRCVAVLVTAYSDFKEVMDAQSDRMLYQVVAKPWRPQKLKDAIERAIDIYNMNAALAAARKLTADKA